MLLILKDINKISLQTNRWFVHPNGHGHGPPSIDHDTAEDACTNCSRNSTTNQWEEYYYESLIYSRKIGRPNTTLRKVLEEDTGLEGDERICLGNVMLQEEIRHGKG